MAAVSGNDGRSHTPHRSQKPNEQSRRGEKRRLIESACTACQKRKSKVCSALPGILPSWPTYRTMLMIARCDGRRPSCTRCQTLHTLCEYNAEEGESRWSALRRRNQVLETERDEARGLLALMQSLPETEALEIYRHMRTHSQEHDLSALIREVRSGCTAHALPQQAPQQQQSIQPNHYSQRDRYQRPQPQTQPQQQPPPNTKFEPSASVTGTVNQLPPLRSIIRDLHLPAAGSNTRQQPPSQTLPPARPAQHRMSQVSGTSNGSYLSASSSGGQEQHSLSPRDDPLPDWAHGFNQ